MKKIFWLASYPKSGNTWVRAFLTNYLSDSNKPVSINELDHGNEFTARAMEIILGIERQDLSLRQIRHYRPLFYSSIANQYNENLFCKLHDVNELNEDGVPIFPKDVTKGVIYILRNPLDVAVSFSKFMAAPIEVVIEIMNEKGYYLVDSNRSFHLYPQNIGSWSENVLSWADSENYPIKIVRYEDLLAQPTEEFREIINFTGVEFSNKKLEKGIRFSDFKKLKKQEEKVVFVEKPFTTDKFFRTGKSGDWRNALTDNQAERIINDHKIVMKRFGYLNENDEPIF